VAFLVAGLNAALPEAEQRVTLRDVLKRAGNAPAIIATRLPPS
jgi:hypothetical protein